MIEQLLGTLIGGLIVILLIKPIVDWTYKI